ncbi:hypothetical protein A2U01_0073410, partial [Trifolium medium]|nr:hypothetical protein [Trifolium medium]
RDPHAAVNLLTTVDQIDQQWLEYMECVLNSDMIGNSAIIQSDTDTGYMTWFFKISHPYIIRIPAGYSIRPTETDVVVQEEPPTDTPTESTMKTHLLGK